MGVCLEEAVLQHHAAKDLHQLHHSFLRLLPQLRGH